MVNDECTMVHSQFTTVYILMAYYIKTQIALHNFLEVRKSLLQNFLKIMKNYFLSIICALEETVGVLRSIRSVGEIIGLYYVDRQHALTRKALCHFWVSYSSVSRFSICVAGHYCVIYC